MKDSVQGRIRTDKVGIRPELVRVELPKTSISQNGYCEQP